MSHVVYTSWDADDWCLYVGCTGDLRSRMQQHSRKSAWHPHMARLDVSEALPKAEARWLERRTIDELGPQFNINHNGWVIGNIASDYDIEGCEALDLADWRAAASAYACIDAMGPYGCGSVPLTDELGYRAFVAGHLNPSTCRAYGLATAAEAWRASMPTERAS